MEVQKMYAIMNAPELEWLKGNVNGTPEGESVSEMEFKRTKLSLDLLKWVLEGDYEHFTECQSDDVKLTKKVLLKFSSILVAH